MGFKGPGTGMIANKESPIHAAVHALHHGKGGWGAAVKAGARVEFFDQNIAAVPVAVCNQKLFRSAGCGPFDGGVDILGHGCTEALVFSVAGVYLVPIDRKSTRLNSSHGS